MVSLFGPKILGKATTSCCLRGDGEETLCLEKLQLQPRHHLNISPTSEIKLKRRRLSARLAGDCSDFVAHTRPGLQVSDNTGFCKNPGGRISPSGSSPFSLAHITSTALF